jgi:hypothetical protein
MCNYRCSTAHNLSHMLAEESGHNGTPGTEAPGEGVVGTGELQESSVSGAEESNGGTSPGEVLNMVVNWEHW